MRGLIALATATAVVVGSAGAAAGSLGESAKKRPPSQAVVAKRLARQIVHAGTPAARYRALLAVMRALNVGVYTAKGKPVVRGGRSALHVYEFELRGLARVLPREQTWTVVELARELDAAGLRPGGQQLSAETLSAVLSSGVRAAVRSPRGRYALLPLLVRQLGLLRQPSHDLVRRAPPDETRLDELQRFLILADVAEAVSARARRAGTQAVLDVGDRHAGATRGRSARQARAAASPCRAGVEAGADRVTKIGKWLAPLTERLPNVVRASTAILDLSHASTMGLLIDIQPARGGQVSETHYGPEGNHPGFTGSHRPGQRLVFQVGVQSLIVQETEGQRLLVECFELAGLRLPPEGPVEGVRVDWNRLGLGDYAKLQRHGTIVREDQRTGKDGLAILVFQPKDEKVPGFPPDATKTDVGVLQPTFDILTPFGSVLGNVPELLTPPFLTMPWSVEYHKPRGFKFEELVLTREWSDPPAWNPSLACTFGGRTLLVSGDSCWYERLDEQHSGKVCGDDPYARPWEFRTSAQRRVVDRHPGHGGGHDVRYVDEWQWSALAEEPYATFYSLPVFAFFGPEARFDLVMAPDGPKARIQSVDSPPGARPFTGLAPLSEALDCPATD